MSEPSSQLVDTPTLSATDRAAELELFLRPAGAGVHVVSTGKAAQAALLGQIYKVAPERAEAAWRAQLGHVDRAPVAILGVPSDNGAGFTRGANRAPEMIRRHLLGRVDHPYHRDEVVDVGDVRVIPHLLYDGMLSADQRAVCRAALYGEHPLGAQLPVSPLDLCRRALDHLFALNPDLVPIVIGGDHSVGWPHFLALHERALSRGRRLGVLHFDAHTDLLPHRLGVDFCFATWAWHANERLGRDGRMVQVGIRASGHERGHWEQGLGVRQIWADEAAERGVNALAEEIIQRFAELGVDEIYVSNDIDGTDPAYAGATGTPEPGGLTPELVSGLTMRVLSAFPLAGADLVEVAPPLSWGDPAEPERTLETSAGYLGDLIACACEQRGSEEPETAEWSGE